MNHNLRRLSTIEPRGDLSMLLLTLMAPTGRLSLPRSRAPTASSLLTECSRVIGKRSEDVGVATLLLQLREQERQWRGKWLGGFREPALRPRERQQLQPGRHCDGIGLSFANGLAVCRREISKLVAAGERRAGVLCLCNDLTMQALGYSTSRSDSFHRHKIIH